MADLQKIGKYDVQDVLGKGGMGSVYRGFDPVISRQVAIKAISKASVGADDLKHIMQRFRHEAQAVGRLVHPRIVQIYDYGEDDAVAYIVMELVNGKTLAQHLQQEVSYEIREVGEIIRQLLDGLGHAHAAGVIHRDVKPSNILINNDGRIKISDFGIARIESSQLTQVGDVLGTPHYMAPEQFLGMDIGVEADLFSVGVIAYELLTGRKPFTGNSAAVMHQVLNQAPVNPTELNPRLSPLLDRVLHTALAKKREDRFQSARAFAEAFRVAIDASIATATAATTIDGKPPPDGNKALAFMAKYHVHVVISDQRMPIMPGVELLRRSHEISPTSVRILLTGYSDLASIVGSINDGEVYRFISKPWDNTDLQTIVAEAATIALQLADTKAVAAELPSKMEAGVLVIDQDEEIFRVARELIGGLCPVIYAADVDAALAVMQAREIAVVITDIEAGHGQLTAMLKLLKQENPQILTIVVTTASDSELVIELINEAQIFRFLNKPVNVRLLKGHVHAALQRYLTYKQSPELLNAQRVQQADQVRASSVGRRILDGIKSLRGKWFRTAEK